MASSRQYAERKGSSSSSRNTSVPEDVNPQVTDKGGRNKDDLLGDMDEVLADIDAVLEENAQEFVQGYVQKGGE